MIKFYLILFISTCFSTSAVADLIQVTPVQAQGALSSWNAAILQRAQALQAAGKYSTSGYRECSETQELRGAFFCVDDNMPNMARGLARASIFIEGAPAEVTGTHQIPKGNLVTQSASETAAYGRRCQGYDLKGDDLLNFYNAVQKACRASKNNPDVCLNQEEKEFFEQFILPQLRRNPQFVLITYALRNTSESGLATASHEIMHAQYFLDPVYRQITDLFWSNELSENERAQIRMSLGKYYDSSDDFLMKNEFQAYVLQYRSSTPALYANLAAQYRPRLAARLKAKGVSPLEVR